MNCPSHRVFNGKSHTNCLMRAVSLTHIYAQQIFLDHKVLELESFRSRLAGLVIQTRHFFHNFFDKWSPAKTGSILVLDSSRHNPCLLLCFFLEPQNTSTPLPQDNPSPIWWLLICPNEAFTRSVRSFQITLSKRINIQKSTVVNSERRIMVMFFYFLSYM